MSDLEGAREELRRLDEQARRGELEAETFKDRALKAEAANQVV